MGFASGFRTGLASGGGGGQRRSMMPIVQGLGSMIDRIERRNKKGSVRIGGKIGGKSSYDKYTERKDAEAAAAEEQRRYDAAQGQKREQMQTDQAAAEQQAERQAVQDEQAAQMHEEKVASIQQKRDEAAKLFERSEKKEKRIEAYRGFVQGIQSRSKALTEASWAALAPDMPKDEEKDWAEIETEDYIDPKTGKPVMDKNGKPIKKYIVGRGKKDQKGMPAPSVEYNDDGSIAVTFPGSDEPEIYADAKTFAEQIGYHLNPEFETDEKGGKGKKKERRQETQDQLKYVEKKIKRLQKRYDNEDPDLSDDDFKAQMAELEAEEDRLMGRGEKTEVAAGGEAEQAAGNLYAGEDPPPDYPNAKRAPDGNWYVAEGGKWKPVLESEENVAQK
jgi:hypothetical protein